MDDNTETATEAIAEPPIEAQINLRDTGKGLDIDVRTGTDAGPLNPAVHFAKWVGANLHALVLLSREDYNAAVERHKQARRLLEVPTTRIMGPDGAPLQ